jgi:hypothetical protein
MGAELRKNKWNAKGKHTFSLFMFTSHHFFNIEEPFRKKGAKALVV